MRASVAAALSILAGLAAWLGPMWVSRVNEGWDSDLYPFAALAMLVAALLLGLASPQHGWLWGWLIVLPQPLLMLALASELGGLAIIGVGLFVIFGALLSGASVAGTAVRYLVSRRRKT